MSESPLVEANYISYFRGEMLGNLTISIFSIVLSLLNNTKKF